MIVVRVDAGPGATILAVSEVAQKLGEANAKIDEELRSRRGRDRFHNGVRLIAELMGLACKQNFRKEGNFPSRIPGVPKVAVFAFKADQVRVYGGFVRAERPACFLCTAMDMAKKRDNADQELLRRSAAFLARYQDDARRPVTSASR
jgi:hypothetical protein